MTLIPSFKFMNLRTVLQYRRRESCFWTNESEIQQVLQVGLLQVILVLQVDQFCGLKFKFKWYRQLFWNGKLIVKPEWLIYLVKWLTSDVCRRIAVKMSVCQCRVRRHNCVAAPCCLMSPWSNGHVTKGLLHNVQRAQLDIAASPVCGANSRPTLLAVIMAVLLILIGGKLEVIASLETTLTGCLQRIIT